MSPTRMYVGAFVEEMRDDSFNHELLPNGPVRGWWSLVGGHKPLKQGF